jgi:GT2 family glycosyltransferase
MVTTEPGRVEDARESRLPHVFIVIPVHDRRTLTQACLESIAVQSYPSWTAIVVDDGSTDGTADMLAELFPGVVVLHGDGSLWWAGATNLGVRWAMARADVADLVLTLNNDAVVGPDYLEKLVRTADAHRHALIGSAVASDEDPTVIVDAAVRFNRLTGAARSDGVGPIPAHSRLVPSDHLAGRGMLVPIVVFRTLGLFDADRLPHYGSDYEFSMRARRAGFELLVDTGSIVVSTSSATGLNPSLRRLTWSQFLTSFFSIRSSNNLWYRWVFYRRALHPRPLAIWFFFVSTARLVVHEIRAQTKHLHPAQRSD